MKKIYQKNQKKAFSLIELSIVIVIATILMTSALSVSVSIINNAKIKITKDRMAELYKALGNYALIHSALPCPAPITDAKSSTATYGVAAASTCSGVSGVSISGSFPNLVRGMMPVRTLGLPADMAEDGFGDKFEYIVDRGLTAESSASAAGNCSTTFGNFGTLTSALCSNITVKEKPGAGAAITIESAAALAIISLGQNKSGAYGFDATSRNTLSTDAEEDDNLPTGAGTTYANVLHISSGSSDVFDDVILFKTRNALVLDFNALSLIPCTTPTTSSETYGTITWPTGWYDQVVVATSPTCASLGYSKGLAEPTKRCGAFGVWDSAVTEPCLN